MSTEEQEVTDTTVKTFKDLGVCDILCQACGKQKWTTPTKIQVKAIPAALAGNDVIGLAETGSGKTGAFALPILQALLASPQPFFALVLTPTRELAKQIEEHFRSLGTCMDVKTVVLVGGQDMKQQRIMLAKRPHIVIATPGRLVDHLQQTGGFHLRTLKYLVMDEADRLLAMDFEKEINEILSVLPRERRTYLFSATMTKKVEKLKRASLTNPAKVEVDSKYKTVDKCQQHYIFIPHCDKEVYLVYLVTEMEGKSIIIFCATCAATERIAQLLRNLNYHALPINGHMKQERRLGSLHKFKCETGRILVATDVASRGLDIPHVDVVINFDSPPQAKDYIHRIGRTARAGRSGQAITLVTQYDARLWLAIEDHLGQKVPLYSHEKEEVMLYKENVTQALVLSQSQLAEKDKKRKRKNHMDQDEEGFMELSKRPKKKRKGK